MKILFIVANANLTGGTELAAFRILHELSAAGIKCRLLSVVPYCGDDSMVVSLSREDYNQWVHLDASPLNKLRGRRRSDSLLCRLITAKAEELEAEWVVNHTYDLTAAIPTDERWKTAQVFNWSIQGYESSLKCIIKKKGIWGRIVSIMSLNAQVTRWHKALSKHTRLVMLTDAAKTEIKRVYPFVKEEQLVTIPNFIMHREESAILTQLQNKNVVFVGRLSHEKGVMRLLRIWEQASKLLSGYTLSIYGEGDIKSQMESFIADKHIEGVNFMGFCNDLEKIYTHSDLLLMTSDSEGFGLVLIEAMYYGVPCIAFDCPISPKEIIADAGATVPCFDEELYAEMMVSILREPGKMKKLQQNAIERSKDFFMDKVVRLWKNMVQ